MGRAGLPIASMTTAPMLSAVLTRSMLWLGRMIAWMKCARLPSGKRRKKLPKNLRKPILKKENPKTTKYTLLKNPENLTQNQQATMEMLIKSDKRLYRSYLLKEGLRIVFKYDYDGAVDALDKWLAWAQRCRIKEFVELGRKIKRHKDAILATIKHGLSNARIEATNNKIKVTIRMGYGYKNIDNLIALVRLKCGGFDVSLPGRKNKD